MFVDDGRYIFIMISHYCDPQQNVGIHFLMKYVLRQQFLYFFTWSSNQFLILNIFSFSFLQTLFTYQLNFSLFLHLNLLPSTRCPYSLFPSFWQSVLSVSCAFWTLCMLVTMHISQLMCYTCHK